MSDDGHHDYQSMAGAEGLLATPHTGHTSPPRSQSRRSSRSSRSSHARTLRDLSSSPPPMPATSNEKSRPGSHCGVDPKRFTPTLHASLVSEILTLRRELDAKHQFIDGLEQTLDSARAQNDELAGGLTRNTKESKLAEQKFRKLETGTLDAVEDLVKERDHAKRLNDELKSKLDTLGKRSRRQEAESEQSQLSWEREKQTWERERRQLEHRVHVTESRLRAFVNDLTAQQPGLVEEHDANEDASDADQTFKDSGFGNASDTESVRSYKILRHARNMSSMSTRSIPRSLGSPTKRQPTNLADELDLDEEDDFDLDHLRHNDVQSLAEGRTESRASSRRPYSSDLHSFFSGRARGLTNSSFAESSGLGKQYRDGAYDMQSVDATNSAAVRGYYVDVGVQPSRPSSAVPAAAIDRSDDATQTVDEEDLERHELTSSLRRIPYAPLSPPEAPCVQTHFTRHDLENTSKPSFQLSASTQTDATCFGPSESASTMLALRRKHSIDALPVPQIAIYPPRSAPTSPGQPILPPGMASVSVQTDISSNYATHDAAVQTEEIRIDRRPVKLPPHLLPSALDTAQGPEPENTDSATSPTSPESVLSPISFPSPPRNPASARSVRHAESKALRSLPPLKAIDLPRPVLFGSPTVDEQGQRDQSKCSAGSAALHAQTLAHTLASWQDGRTEHGPGDFGDINPKDLFGNTPGLARPAVRTTFSGLPKTVPEDREISPLHMPFGTASIQSHSWRDSTMTTPSKRPASSHDRSSRSGRGGLHTHSRSTSATSLMSRSQGSSSRMSFQPQPPYPIPTRSSSRMRSNPVTEASSSPSPYDTRSLHTRRSSNDLHARRGSLRKVQSSQNMKQQTRMSPRRRRRAPQLTPIQSMAFDASQISLPTGSVPPSPFALHKDDDAWAVLSSEEARHAMLADEEAIEDDPHDTNLVDAIAATMVGEWMWKYTRRRSFGVSDSGRDFATGDGTGSRHKRWVWLSPYERTVMWSTKQPNSGPALLGKNGRKLNIKSVLDVKDDGAPPKAAGGESAFDRSIVILTTERALKFTAPNRERHYLWITALSFLAGSGRGPPQIPRVPVDEAEPQRQRRISFKNGRSVGVRQSSGSRVSAAGAAPVIVPATPVYRSSAADHSRESTNAAEDRPAAEAADAPTIPRMSAPRHRKNNSNPPVPPRNALRSLSSNAIGSNTTSSYLSSLSKVSSNALSHGKRPTSSSRRPSIGDTDGPNFFEAVDTVRMDAFVDPSLQGGTYYIPGPALATKQTGRRRRESTYSNRTATTDEKRKMGYVFDEHGRDPFRGF